MSTVQDDVDAIDALKSAIEPRSAVDDAACVAVFGVRIMNWSESHAVDFIEQAISRYKGQSRAIYFVNAHTLNLAAQQTTYRNTLNCGDAVFGDGTGVRWAARHRGVRMKANLNGTDLVPRLFQATAGCGYRYYLLGATADTIERAAASARQRFPGWTLAGFHHGYISQHSCPEVIQQINTARPHVLMVGMGNPLQEQWIDRHLDELRVPVCMGTGGLFDHWAGNLRRARAGCALSAMNGCSCCYSSHTSGGGIYWATRAFCGA